MRGYNRATKFVYIYIYSKLSLQFCCFLFLLFVVQRSSRVGKKLSYFHSFFSTRFRLFLRLHAEIWSFKCFRRCFVRFSSLRFRDLFFRSGTRWERLDYPEAGFGIFGIVNFQFRIQSQYCNLFWKKLQISFGIWNWVQFNN